MQYGLWWALSDADTAPGAWHDRSVSALSDAVLPLIRTHADVHRWSAANRHGEQMHEGVDLLENAAAEDPAEVFRVTQRAIRSAMSVIMRADDSSGIIGDACRRLLDLHAATAGPARVAPAPLVRWLFAFQFDQECDFFTIDPVAYAPALGERGIRAYRHELDKRRAALGAEPSGDDAWRSPHSGDWFTIHHNDRRLAVYDRDAEAIIRTHARDQQVPAWLQDTAQAFEEIGEFDLAIAWAERAVAHPVGGHQAITAAAYLGELLAKHRPDALLDARLATFDRWPTSMHAAAVREAAGTRWLELRDGVFARLATSPREAVAFALTTPGDERLAWTLAHDLGLDGDDVWDRLLTAYEKVDPLATLPHHTRLAVGYLARADARNYRLAARRLARMRTLAAGSPLATEVDDLIAQLRLEHRRRPRLQQEFTRADLP